MAVDIADQPAPTVRRTRSGKELIYRHSVTVRLTHWINVLCIFVLLMSGMQIFNAHPMLHWGIKGDEADPALLACIRVSSRYACPTLIAGSAVFIPSGNPGSRIVTDLTIKGPAHRSWNKAPAFVHVPNAPPPRRCRSTA